LTEKKSSKKELETLGLSRNKMRLYK